MINRMVKHGGIIKLDAIAGGKGQGKNIQKSEIFSKNLKKSACPDQKWKEIKIRKISYAFSLSDTPLVYYKSLLDSFIK